MRVDLRELTSTDDPYAAYAELREKHPVAWCEDSGVYALSRYEDVRRALLDPATYSSGEGIMPNGFVGEVPMLLTIDPPRHDLVRKTVQRAFAPQRLRKLEAQVRGIVRERIDALVARGSGDLYTDFAVPIPVSVIALLLGVEVEDQDHFIRCCDAIVTGLDGTGQEALAAQRELLRYFERVFPERRARPAGDLVSELLPEVDSGAITEAELLGLCFLILIAGTETTTNALSTALVLLDRRRELRARLAGDRAAIRRAVEEFLRFETPVQGLSRTLTRDVELHGKKLGVGERVHLLFGCANRDERAFERADQLDLARDPNPHLTFGFGVHFCLGAYLARLELRVAFEEWLARVPDYSIDRTGLARVQSFTNRGYCRVPSRLGE
jgi:cytochrome P450